MPKILPCEGYQTWTDGGYEYDCHYEFDGSCEACVCAGGHCDPRYLENKQPSKLSKFILRTADEACKRHREIQNKTFSKPLQVAFPELWKKK